MYALKYDSVSFMLLYIRLPAFDAVVIFVCSAKVNFVNRWHNSVNSLLDVIACLVCTPV